MDFGLFQRLKQLYLKDNLSIISVDKITINKKPPYKIKRFVRRYKLSVEYFLANIYMVKLQSKVNYGAYQAIFYNPTKNKITALSYVYYEDMSHSDDKEYFSNQLDLNIHPEINSELLTIRKSKYGLIQIVDSMTYSAFQNIGLMDNLIAKCLKDNYNYMFFLKAAPKGHWHLPKALLIKFYQKHGFKHNKVVDKYLPDNDYMFKY
jgi:hypothetical protein